MVKKRKADGDWITSNQQRATSKLLIDLHCHILPNIDDGSQSLSQSLTMARSAVKDGIHSIVATPHTLNGVYTNPADKVAIHVANLQEVFSKNNIQLQLYPGAEVQLCPNMLERINSGEAGTINNSGKYLLLELPSQTIPKGIKDEIFTLKLNGITPIVTHPERNSIIQHDPDILYELVNRGALVQITAMSITGDFGEFVKQAVEMMLKQRVVHLIASDAHSHDNRPPVLSHAVEIAAKVLGSSEEAKYMVSDRPAAILSGDIVEIPEPVPYKSKPRFFAKSF